MNQLGYYRQIALNYYVLGKKKLGWENPNSQARMTNQARMIETRNRFNLVILVSDLIRHSGFGFLLFFLSLLLSSAGICPASSTQPQNLRATLQRLTNELRSDDATTRQSAAAGLTALGANARPAVLQLIKSDDPGVRQQALQILLRLPWYAPDDPAEVKTILVQYGTPDIESRRNRIHELDDLQDNKAAPALRRLLEEEPSPAVQWTIVSCLRQEQELAPLRDVAPPAGNSRMLAACGYALAGANWPAALDDLSQCASLELADPTDDDGEFDFVIRILANAACEKKDYDEAADWRRKEYARGSPTDRFGTSIALLELFALHGEYGPLKGLDQDLKRAGREVESPKIQYALSVMAQRNGKPAEADAARKRASASIAARDRVDVGDFLSNHGWDDLAEREYADFLNSPVNFMDSEMRTEAANVHFRLSALAEKHGDDQAAAEQKEQMLQTLQSLDLNALVMVDDQGRRWAISVSDMWADVYWHYLKAAMTRHDSRQAQRRMEQLLELRPTNPDIAIDVVPILEKMNRRSDAQMLFDLSFEDLKKKIAADPRDADNLNGLAWLCANCNRHLPEALQWAKEAAVLMPNNAAILDTFAEVNFRLGRPGEALRLETQAVKIEPDDSFMKQQIERFRAAAATRPG